MSEGKYVTIIIQVKSLDGEDGEKNIKRFSLESKQIKLRQNTEK